MSDINQFKTRIRGLMAAQREAADKENTFDPRDLLSKLLGLRTESAKLAPGVRETAQRGVRENVNAPYSQAYLRTLAQTGGTPGQLRAKALTEQGLATELDKMRPTQKLPAAAPAEKKKRWWEWLDEWFQ